MRVLFIAEQVIDSELSKYLYRYGSHTGILVARPKR